MSDVKVFDNVVLKFYETLLYKYVTPKGRFMITDTDQHIKNTLGENAKLTPEILSIRGWRRQRIQASCRDTISCRYKKIWRGIVFEIAQWGWNGIFILKSNPYVGTKSIENIRELKEAMNHMKSDIDLKQMKYKLMKYEALSH